MNFLLRIVVFSSSTDEKSNAVRRPWFDPQENLTVINDNARRAFETVLYVRQRLYTGERFRRFASSVADFARETNRTKHLTHETVRIENSIKKMCFFLFVVSLRFCFFVVVGLEIVHWSESIVLIRTFFSRSFPSDWHRRNELLRCRCDVFFNIKKSFCRINAIGNDEFECRFDRSDLSFVRRSNIQIDDL